MHWLCGIWNQFVTEIFVRTSFWSALIWLGAKEKKTSSGYQNPSHQKYYNTAKDDHAQYLMTTQLVIAFLVDKHMYKTKPTTTFTYIAEIETRYRNYYFESPDHEWKQQLLYR